MRIALIAALALGGCSVTTIKKEMTGLKGQPISAAVARLGMPDEETTIMGQKVYTWRNSTVYGGDQYGCKIRVVMAGNVIGSFSGSGDVGSCQEYAAKLSG